MSSSFQIPTQTPPAYAGATKEAQRLLENIILEGCTIEYVVINGTFNSAQFGDTDFNGNVEFRFDASSMNFEPTGQLYSYTAKHAFPMDIAARLRTRIYSFKAERMNIGEAPVGTRSALLPDASNLSEVLHNLISSDSNRFQHYVSLISKVLPEIKGITVPLVSAQNSRILLWTIDPSMNRADLAMPLSHSGTGISQVMAILYVILTADYPQVINIDEPQSFLHPGAVRKLLDILKQHPQHQYIITTHSPTAVTAANPENLIMVLKEKGESVIKPIDVTQNQQLRMYLSEMGARLSDVFGSDNILWVEGRTEEECFPLIVSHILDRSLLGTTIIGVMHTSDFEGRHSEKIFEIYRRLSQGRGLLPPALGFIFDREGRTQDQIDDLQRMGRDADSGQSTVFFTPRKMYENYLLEPEAIAHLMATIEGFRDIPVTADEISDWLEQDRWNNKKYFEDKVPEESQNPMTWLNEVHAANLLEDMFIKFSESRVSYNNYKVEYGQKLTQWLIENKPEAFAEIAELIGQALNGQGNQ